MLQKLIQGIIHHHIGDVCSKIALSNPLHADTGKYQLTYNHLAKDPNGDITQPETEGQPDIIVAKGESSLTKELFEAWLTTKQIPYIVSPDENPKKPRYCSELVNLFQYAYARFKNQLQDEIMDKLQDFRLANSFGATELILGSLGATEIWNSSSGRYLTSEYLLQFAARLMIYDFYRGDITRKQLKRIAKLTPKLESYFRVYAEKWCEAEEVLDPRRRATDGTGFDPCHFHDHVVDIDRERCSKRVSPSEEELKFLKISKRKRSAKEEWEPVLKKLRVEIGLEESGVAN